MNSHNLGNLSWAVIESFDTSHRTTIRRFAENGHVLHPYCQIGDLLHSNTSIAYNIIKFYRCDILNFNNIHVIIECLFQIQNSIEICEPWGVREIQNIQWGYVTILRQNTFWFVFINLFVIYRRMMWKLFAEWNW